MRILLVRVRGERFGIPAEIVKEIIRAVEVSPLPGAPTVISGVINVRGETVVVIDPAVRFGQAEIAVRASDNFVLAYAGTREVAIRVDAAEDLITVDEHDVASPDTVSPSLSKLSGVASLADGTLLIYDVGAFLSQVENEALEAALAGVSESYSRVTR